MTGSRHCLIHTLTLSCRQRALIVCNIRNAIVWSVSATAERRVFQPVDSVLNNGDDGAIPADAAGLILLMMK